MNNIVALILSAGSAAFLTAVVTGLRSISTTRLESEEAFIKRLTADSESARLEAKTQRERAEAAEEDAALSRVKLNKALEDSTRYRILLIEAGILGKED